MLGAHLKMAMLEDLFFEESKHGQLGASCVCRQQASDTKPCLLVEVSKGKQIAFYRETTMYITVLDVCPQFLLSTLQMRTLRLREGKSLKLPWVLG